MGRPKVVKFCEHCGKECSRKNRFCDAECGNASRQTKWVERWLAGKESGARAKVLTSYRVKRYLKDTRGEKCELCGWSERNQSTGLIPLHLDHKDGDYRNNRPENVRLICPNDHSLTCNYGGANRGHGRPFIVYKKSAGGVANGRQELSKSSDAGSNPATPAN